MILICVKNTNYFYYMSLLSEMIYNLFIFFFIICEFFIEGIPDSVKNAKVPVHLHDAACD